jgi:phosphohistidine phosphatase SixA
MEAKVVHIGGFLRTGNYADAIAQDAQTASNALYDKQAAQPVVIGLAGEIRAFFRTAREGRTTIEQEMIEALLARRGQYTAAKLAQIQEQNQPAIYMMVASSKMRQIEALCRDVLIGAGDEKPWTLRPGKVPDLPPSAVQAAVQQLAAEIEQAMASGFPPLMEQVQARMREIRDEMTARLMEEAKLRTQRMEDKMEDQFNEGGFTDALDQFITDLATFKTAYIAGPIVRRKPALEWSPENELIVQTKLKLEWERVDPFDVFPAPWAKNIQHGPLIRRWRLSRTDLEEMIGVEGFSEPAIRKVLERFADQGFRTWTAEESAKTIAEGKQNSAHVDTELIDTLQYWGSASGKMLRDWGMTAEQVPDVTKQYQIEAWQIDSYVIKAVLNADPLARRPLYAASFQRVPGSVWGNAPYDLMRDCQDMCNGSARALAANMGISSGPQVGIISNRLPAGESITQMYPWKIWQFESDPMGSTAKPIEFFQPSSNANELMAVFERFSQLADEYTGVPRYMAGFETAGAGRTASGMSMMIGNASKIIRQVVGGVDTQIIVPGVLGLHYHNMRYGDDPDLKGDINPQALGALSLVTKDAAQVRTNEFLTATANPIDMQILGMEGRAELLRSAVKRLDVNSDRVVPPLAVMRQRAAEQALQAQQQLMLAPPDASQPGGANPNGSQPKPGGGEQLMNGAPITDTFAPQGA